MGPWWPAPSAALRAAAQHWATWAMQKQELARNLISQHDLLLRNQGRTAEDLIGRYLRGAKSEVTKAEKYEIKKGAFNTAADAIDYLRSRLTGIAGEGNKEIDDVLASKKPLPEQLAEIQAIQTRCNADAANASRDAVDKVMTAMQEILEAEDIGDDPRTWARANGFNVDDAPPPRLIRENDLAALTGPGARGGSFGSVEGAGDLASPQSVGAGGFSGSGVQAACSQPAPRAIGASSRHASAGPVPPAPVVTTPAAATPPVIATGPRWRCPAGRCRRRPSDRSLGGFGGRWDIGRGHRGRCGRRRRRPGRRRYASDELHTSRQRFRIGHQRQAGRVAAQRGFGRRRRARADDHGGWHPYRRHAGRTCGGGSPRIPWQVRAGRDGACCR